MVLTESDYQSQVERVIQTLKTDLPTLFEQDISYDVYSPDIFFRDPVNEFKGKFNYHLIFWTLRFHARLFFREISFDVHDISQTTSDTIRVDWTVWGILRVPPKAIVCFNGYSNYSLNENGLIDNHIDTWDRMPREVLRQFFNWQGNGDR